MPSFSGESYLTYAIPELFPPTSYDISLSLRTASSAGLILFARGNNSSFFSLGIQDGLLVLQFKLNSEPLVTIRSSFYAIDDASWHLVNISIQNGVGTLYVDDRITFGGSSRSNTQPFSLVSPLYVGGSSDLSSLPTGVVPQASGFVGCISDLQFDSESVDFLNYIDGADISECAMGACTSSTCMNGGVCIEQPSTLPQGYKCNCAIGFAGTNCEQGTDRCIHECTVKLPTVDPLR